MTDPNAVQPYAGGTIQVGATNMGASDFIPPRVKIVQALSDEVKNKQASAGDFFDTLRGVSYGPKLDFTPIMTFMQRVFIVRNAKKPELNTRLEAAGLSPLPDGDGLMCRSVDMVHGRGDPGIACAQCPMAEWEGRTGAPPCSETYNIAALTDKGDVVFLGFSKSAAKAGKKAFSMLRMQMGAPSARVRPWDRMWQATTRMETNDQGDFYVPDVIQTQEETANELKVDAAYWNTQFTGVAFDVAEQEASVQAADVGESEPTGKKPF